MSLLRERLGRLKKSTGGGPSLDEIGTGSGSSPEESAFPGIDPGWDRLDARLESNGWGSFIMRRKEYPLDYAHGTYRLGELQGEAGCLSALAAPAVKRGGRKIPVAVRAEDDGAKEAMVPPGGTSLHRERLLFLDTETTGLGVGAGNVAFMVGIGFYEDQAFVVEQLFIRNPAEEAAMLHHLRTRLAERDTLVSYNGKCFDWPILKNRYILNRQKEQATDPSHLDFLYPSRSLWRNTLPSCRLSSVERGRLGLSRLDDVPGSLAPALYFQYLAEGDPALLSGVFEHNEKDVLTLACLAAHLAKLLRGEAATSRMEPEELFRLALWLDKLGRETEADEAFRELLERESDQAADYWLPAAEFYKRQGRLAAAVALWERTIERKRRSRIASLTPYVELAMFYEHRDKDYARALAYAEQALERASGRLSALRGEGGGDELQAIRKRVERLRAKRDAVERKAGAVRGTGAGGRTAGKRAAERSRGSRERAHLGEQELLPLSQEDDYREQTHRAKEGV
ncbi:ribonuclease H-like domain-containing protein [Paenibacillus hodogayensis]|uniref:Ribonuclease H-like domain-containing protein n=1 Tax=Paenibacillus hodogayensis TaxID=279208 RepID=A0ABV5W453_9BACL